MPKIVVYNAISLDGYFTDAKGDMSWAHQRDPEWQEFVSKNAAGGGQLLFGRNTYDLMASFWPTPMAAQSNQRVAERLNSMPKFVVSRTIETASWNNTKVLRGDLTSEVRKLKQEPGRDITIMGSGSIVMQLTAAGLIDEYQIVLCPIVLGSGRTLFEGIEQQLPMHRAQTRTFANGNIVVSYALAE